MISMKSNHLYKKSERTRWFVTNPPVLKFPSRPNSSRSDGIFCPHPRRRRGASYPFRIRKFQSAEGERFELSVGFPTPRFQRGALDHYATLPFSESIYNIISLTFFVRNTYQSLNPL